MIIKLNPSYRRYMTSRLRTGIILCKKNNKKLYFNTSKVGDGH